MFNLCMSFLILDSEIDAGSYITSPLFILVVVASFILYFHKA